MSNSNPDRSLHLSNYMRNNHSDAQIDHESYSGWKSSMSPIVRRRVSGTRGDACGISGT